MDVNYTHLWKGSFLPLTASISLKVPWYLAQAIFAMEISNECFWSFSVSYECVLMGIVSKNGDP